MSKPFEIASIRSGGWQVIVPSAADSSRSPKSIAAKREPGLSAETIRRHVAAYGSGARNGKHRLAFTRSQAGSPPWQIPHASLEAGAEHGAGCGGEHLQGRRLAVHCQDPPAGPQQLARVATGAAAQVHGQSLPAWAALEAGSGGRVVLRLEPIDGDANGLPRGPFDRDS